MADPKSRVDRLDHDGEARLLVKMVRPLSWFLWLAGSEHLAPAELRSLAAKIEANFAELDSIAETLAPLGWVVTEDTPHDEYRQAADLVRAGNPREAEALIADWWDGGEGSEGGGWALTLTVQEVLRLYRVAGAEYRDYEAEAIGFARSEVVREAVINHKEGRYASAIALAFAQIDGITADFPPDGPGYMFFSRRRGTTEPRAKVVDDVTLAGHPGSLAAVVTLLTEKVTATEVTDRLRRHGQMHGRDLGTDTRINSVKALALLRAVVSWAHPTALLRLEAAAVAAEKERAGVRGVDERGRQLDRRAFAAAKASLKEAYAFQGGHHRRHGRYAPSVQEATPAQFHYKLVGIQSLTSTTGDAFAAWIKTPSGWVLGRGASAEQQAEYYFAGPEAPTSTPPNGWYEGTSRKYGHPDWVR